MSISPIWGHVLVRRLLEFRAAHVTKKGKTADR